MNMVYLDPNTLGESRQSSLLCGGWLSIFKGLVSLVPILTCPQVDSLASHPCLCWVIRVSIQPAGLGFFLDGKTNVHVN